MNAIVVISTQVIAQGYVSKDKEQNIVKKQSVTTLLDFHFQNSIYKESNKAFIVPQLA